MLKINFLVINCSILFIFLNLNVNCVPVQNLLSSQKENGLTNRLKQLNEDLSPTKLSKRSNSLNLYQSNIVDSNSISGQHNSKNINGDIIMSIDKIDSDSLNQEVDPVRLIDNVGHRSCQIGTETRDLCELCSKAIKSEVAYAYCCINKDEVRDWCRKFIAYSFTTIAN